MKQTDVFYGVTMRVEWNNEGQKTTWYATPWIRSICPAAGHENHCKDPLFDVPMSQGQLQQMLSMLKESCQRWVR